MEAATDRFSQWLAQAQISESAFTVEQRSLLHAAFRFRQRQGADYFSTRLLSHFLLHCDAGLKVAQIARLLNINRVTASRQQGLSSKEAIQAAHHRLAGRAYGKLLPRYAGPIAEFLCTHPEATRYDLLEYIQRIFGVRVSKVALSKYLKKFGLDRASLEAAASTSGTEPAAAAGAAPASAELSQPLASVPAATAGFPNAPLPLPAPPFSSAARSMRVPSCSCPRP
jgi:transposase